MSKSDVFALQHSALNDFLFAAVGMEANGTALSLVSVFARQGDDPWREAGKLLSLPKSAAIHSVASTIAGMPASVWTLADATAIATRLVALLPTQSASAERGPGTDGARAAHLVRIGLVLASIAFGIVSTLGLFMGRHASTPGGSDVASFTSDGSSAAPSAMHGCTGGGASRGLPSR